MSREFRELSDLTKQRISQSLTGRPLSDIHKANISKSMKDYWQTIPNKPTGESTENKSTTDKAHATQENV